MARIRSIKPDFWEDYRLAKELTRDQRLFYVGLWNQADDEGRFLAHPRRLLGAIFPYDEDVKPKFIEDTLKLLADTGRVLLYAIGNEPYGQLKNFAKHQRINRPSPSRIPSPDNNEAVLIERSVNPQRVVTEASLLEQGTGKGKEQGTLRDDVLEVFQHWQQRLDKPRSSLTEQRERAIRARFASGVTKADLLLAIDGVALSEFHRGKYDDLTSIFANDTRVEQHMERALRGATVDMDTLTNDVEALLLAAGDMAFYPEGRKHALAEAMEKYPDAWARAGPIMDELNYAFIRPKKDRARRDAIAGEIGRIRGARSA